MAEANGSTEAAPIHRDFSRNFNPEYLNKEMSHEDALQRIRTAGSISISPELFEKMYLTPENRVKGDLRKTFGNPTPFALIGFLISLSPLACDLMGWRGTGGAGVGAAGVGTYYFFGGLMMIIGAVGEWILGNTFPMVTFGTYGAFWLSFAATLQPAYNAWGAYSPDPANPVLGLEAPAWFASYAFFFLAMGFASIIFFFCAFRTNIALVIIFMTLSASFPIQAGGYWHAAKGRVALAHNLQIAAGACLFVTCAAGWWLFISIMFQALDMPIEIPVGDLSTVIKGASERKREKHHKKHDKDMV